MMDGKEIVHFDVEVIQSKPLNVEVMSQNSEIGALLETGTLLGKGEGTEVVVNPPDEPSGHMRTIKVNTETYDLDESDPTVPEWAKTPSKPNYTAEEVGAVDADNELAYAEIDRMFNAVFGI